MRNLIKFLLIIGVCTGLSLEAGHQCKCKTRIPKEQRAEKKAHHKAADKRIKQAFNKIKADSKECCTVSTIYWSPDKNYAFNDKIKRAPNGDRV
jgi:hypothetical protein